MVVDLRVSWPSSGSLDFRLKTENIPKMKLRLDWSTKMIMLLLTPVNRSLTLMATLRLEVLGLSSQSPLINGISAALLEVSFTFAKFCQLVVTMRRISCGAGAPARMALVWRWLHSRQQRLRGQHSVRPHRGTLQTGITMVEKKLCELQGELRRFTCPRNITLPLTAIPGLPKAIQVDLSR